jgi:hypothetical protein
MDCCVSEMLNLLTLILVNAWLISAFIFFLFKLLLPLVSLYSNDSVFLMKIKVKCPLIWQARLPLSKYLECRNAQAHCMNKMYIVRGK